MRTPASTRGHTHATMGSGSSAQCPAGTISASKSLPVPPRHSPSRIVPDRHDSSLRKNSKSTSRTWISAHVKQKQTPEPEFEKRTKSVKVNLTESEYKAYCKK